MHRDVVALQCRQPSLEGTGEIPLRRLVKEALRMRPSRILGLVIVGAETSAIGSIPNPRGRSRSPSVVSRAPRRRASNGWSAWAGSGGAAAGGRTGCGRPNGVRRGQLEPADWPSWVLSFGKGYFPDDPDRQAVRMAEFRTWQKDSDAWRAEAGVTWMDVYNEHRRRTIAGQESHPEDRGPTWRPGT